MSIDTVEIPDLPSHTHCDSIATAKQERMITMTDISFSTPAQLLASRHAPLTRGAHGTGPVDYGSLGRMVGRVMSLEPGERRHYAISADGGSHLHAHEIEALAGTRRYADWNAGQG
jgi:hypothetical protein